MKMNNDANRKSGGGRAVREGETFVGDAGDGDGKSNGLETINVCRY